MCHARNYRQIGKSVKVSNITVFDLGAARTRFAPREGGLSLLDRLYLCAELGAGPHSITAGEQETAHESHSKGEAAGRVRETGGRLPDFGALAHRVASGYCLRRRDANAANENARACRAGFAFGCVASTAKVPPALLRAAGFAHNGLFMLCL